MQPRITIFICALILASTTLLLAQKPSAILGVDAPHGDSTKLSNLCADCHFGFNAPNTPATLNDKCLSCHNGTTAAAAETHRGLSCTTCHNPHHQEQQRAYDSQYSKLVRTTINQRSVRLMASSGVNSFADGDSVYNGVCEVCHSTTKYHRNDGTGQSHNNGANCTSCHPHDVGFSGASGGPNCLGCHQSAMGSRRAVGPDFATTKPHHPLTFNPGGDLNLPANNNCLICHNDYPNLHADGKIDFNPDPDHSGSQEWSGVYPDAWCMDCHDGDNPDPNYRLGGKVAPDKRAFYSTANVHGNGTAFSGRCIDCHNETNEHTAAVKFYSSFYMDDSEENMCYGCHGGGANVNTGGRYMENIRVAFTTGTITSKSVHAASADLNTSDGKVFCRNCHDPHLLNHTTNLLIDPKNITQPWTGMRRDLCFQCHERNTTTLHGNHNGVSCNQCHDVMNMSISTQCTECHLPHSSATTNLLQVNITGKTLSVSPSSVNVVVSNSQQFNAITSPAFAEFSQAIVNRFTDWGFVTTSGGSPGSEFSRIANIPLDRSIGFDPNGNGGWGLITVTSTITIPDNTTIEDLDVYFNATHHYRGDIDLTLTHVQTGTTVHVQASDWGDWEPNLNFYYDSESPNNQHGSTSPRSTAESLTKFNGELIGGDWVLTILDTWPWDNSTNPSSPDYCIVNSWGLKVNGSVLGSFTSAGLFQTSYAGAGTVYATLHNGKINPVQSGLNVGVFENPLPIQSTASLNVTTILGKAAVTVESPNPSYIVTPLVHPTKPIRQSQTVGLGANGHASLNGKSCNSCHGR